MTLERTDTTFDLSYKNITQKDGFYKLFIKVRRKFNYNLMYKFKEKKKCKKGFFLYMRCVLQMWTKKRKE